MIELGSVGKKNNLIGLGEEEGEYNYLMKSTYKLLGLKFFLELDKRYKSFDNRWPARMFSSNKYWLRKTIY